MAIKFTTQPVAKNATSRGLDTLSAAECKLQDKTVEYVENSQYEILPDEGYDGIAKVDVTVNVPIPEPKLQSKNYNIVTNGDTTITPDAGFVGSTISVNVPTPEPNLQEKSTTISQNGASTIMYCPKDLDISAYYEIDLSKHQQYVDLQTQKIEEKLKLEE